MSPAVNPKTGRVIYREISLDPAIVTASWQAGLTGGTLGGGYQGAASAITNASFTPPVVRPFMEIKLDEADAATAGARKINDPVSPNLDRFRAHGGKIIYYHGTGDQILSYQDTVDYVEALQKRYGHQTGSFARFFSVPGMLHCAGGNGLTNFDPLTSIVDWVEKGKAPDRIVAGNAQERPGETRPLCPYPSYATYDGRGDPKRADSYSCKK